jgi:hypothetical protein
MDYSSGYFPDDTAETVYYEYLAHSLQEHRGLNGGMYRKSRSDQLAPVFRD